MSKQNEALLVPKIGISCGDLNGIGLEVVLKTFQDQRIFQTCTPVLYVNPKAAAQYRKILNIHEPGFHQIKNLNEISNKNINVVVCSEDEFQVQPGINSTEAGKLALSSIQKACADLQKGIIQCLVTAPINKHNIQSPDFSFPGHTEYLAKEFNTNDYMMLLLSQELKLGTITGHIPISEVSKALSIDKIISKVKLIYRHFPRDFNIRKPKIAILGLNPHAGDNGLIGDEEAKIVIPAITKLKEEGMLVSGPFGADGFFGTGSWKKYDVTLSLYHDQGLIPFKTLSFSDGVNYTMGLPVVRTSPDHGTAYDIAGKNMADENSFRQSVYSAVDIYNNRLRFDDFSSDPLKITNQKREREREK